MIKEHKHETGWFRIHFESPIQHATYSIILNLQVYVLAHLEIVTVLMIHQKSMAIIIIILSEYKIL